jgi:hypothetical protein
MTAEVFRLTDLTPLMDSKTIRRLASEGAFFGSHLATHRAIACRGRAAAPLQPHTREFEAICCFWRKSSRNCARSWR